MPIVYLTRPLLSICSVIVTAIIILLHCCQDMLTIVIFPVHYAYLTVVSYFAYSSNVTENETWRSPLVDVGKMILGPHIYATYD